MTNLDSILKSRDITLPTKVCIVKAMVFPVIIYGCESWTIKKAVDDQSLSRVQLFATPWTVACQVSLPLMISQSLLKFMSVESVMPSKHLILCHPLLLLPSIFPSIRVFSNELALWIRWPKCCSFYIRPSNEYSGLISFRIDWFDLLAFQRTLKSLLQYHSLKASILQLSAFFIVQLSHFKPIYIYTHIQAYIRVCIYMYIYICIYMCVYICVYIYVYIYTHTYIHTHTHTHIYMYIHILTQNLP